MHNYANVSWVQIKALSSAYGYYLVKHIQCPAGSNAGRSLQVWGEAFHCSFSELGLFYEAGWNSRAPLTPNLYVHIKRNTKCASWINVEHFRKGRAAHYSGSNGGPFAARSNPACAGHIYYLRHVPRWQHPYWIISNLRAEAAQNIKHNHKILPWVFWYLILS